MTPASPSAWFPSTAWSCVRKAQDPTHPQFVAALNRPVAGNGNDRVCVDTGDNRCRGHRLQDRVVWRHAEQAAGSEATRIDFEV